LRNCRAEWCCLKQKTSRAAMAKPGLLVDHDRTIGGGNECERIIRL
jgi:hypothetical protein